ncbi:unnamed protein product [Symbiodinium natans]|uniref:Uncharacterized protein n=1 Tax=Symbiodinium natans TaxID=878477 RepID=A0A812U7A8_9DINO|nr:unnamed protein product [Symbiodinium natans]
MMVLISGGKVPNHHYQQTAQAIQDSAAQEGLSLWLVIPTVFQNLCIISCFSKSFCSPLHSAVEAALSAAAKQGWERGRDSEDLWLAGHSLGATCANVLFQAYNSSKGLPYAGLVVMGGYVDEAGDYDLIHYPVPVLSLNVELDGGLARPGKISTWWHQFLQLREQEGSEAVTSKSVIVLPKLNHSDFCPGFDVPGDLPAEVTQSEATRTIGETIAAFLTLHWKGAEGDRASALRLLTRQLEWTEELMTPYLKAQQLERTATDHNVSSEGTSPFCRQAQRVLAGLSAADAQKLEVEDGFHISSPNLEHCHPAWTVNGSKLLVHSCSHTNFYPDISNTGKITAAEEIACKLLSADRVAEQLKTHPEHDRLPCAAMNRMAVEMAEQLAASSTLQRYRAKGRGWCFLEDSSSVAGPVWVFKDRLALKENSTCMAVQSPSMLTDLSARIYPGIHYCKLLSPARVLDWMMTDSLKPGSRDDLSIII